MIGLVYDSVVSLRSVSLSVIKLFRSFPVISGHYRFCNPCLIFAPKLLNQHALKGQKLLAPVSYTHLTLPTIA